MSRSYRKPYCAVTGVYTSSADDKRIARRNWRHLQNHRLRVTEDWDAFINPHRLEARYNNTWSWGRDGSQYLHFPPVLDWDLYHWHKRSWYWSWYWMTEEEHVQVALENFERDVEWYEKLKRK